MATATDVISALKGQITRTNDDVAILERFFKTGPGQYGEGDVFIGVRVPDIRKVCRQFADMSLGEIETLLESKIHEVRLAAVIIMSNQTLHKKTSEAQKEALYNLYLRRSDRINNWDIVDSSAAAVVGAYLANKPRDILYSLAKSEDIWERRIAIISTFWFIRKGELDDTFAIAEILLHDRHDLIHKAVGWMLREAGKRNEVQLRAFLKKHAPTMPRTALRYAIERFSPEERLYFLSMRTTKL